MSGWALEAWGVGVLKSGWHLDASTAFDALFLTIRPEDHRIVVRRDILTEEDGPMLLHGLQGLHGQPIQRPRNPALRPDPELLAARWDRFVSAAAAS
jgi:putative restriction endonuclease